MRFFARAGHREFLEREGFKAVPGCHQMLPGTMEGWFKLHGGEVAPDMVELPDPNPVRGARSKPLSRGVVVAGLVVAVGAGVVAATMSGPNAQHVASFFYSGSSVAVAHHLPVSR